MRLASRIHLSGVMLLGAAVALGARQPQSTTLRGAWRIVATSLTAGETPAYRSYSQPGLLILTARHYSLMYVEGNESRRMFRDPARPSDAEKVDAFDTFAGHSGTYVVEDSIVAMDIAIAKSPNLMGPELRTTFGRFAFQLSGDTLRLTRRTPRGAFAMQLVRVE